MLRAVIFDMDGTLLDSEVIHYYAIQKVLKEAFGIRQSMEEYLPYIGIPDSEMFPQIARKKMLRWPSAYTAEELERRHWEEYDRYVAENGVRRFPGVQELMAALRTEGIRIAIGTGSLRRLVEENMDRLGLRAYVNAVATSEDCDRGKPAPDVFLTAARFLEVSPEDCLVIEDSRNGLTAAERAGMARAGFGGSRLPADVGTAPVIITDYREVTPADLIRWHRDQMGG